MDDLRRLADALPQIVWTANPDGWLDYYNKRWFEYTGLTLEQTQGWGWGPVLHPDDLQKCIARWTESFTTGVPYEIEYRFKRASDGEYRWHLGRASAVRDDEGNIVKWFGTGTDIHEHKLLEDSLRANEKKLQTLSDSMPIIIWSATPDGVPEYYNRMWYQYTGLKDLESGAKLIHPDDWEALHDAWSTSIATGSLFEMRYRLLKQDTQEYRWMLVRGVPVYEDGEIIHWFGTATDIDDITRYQESQAELTRDRDLAIEAARLRSEFLANMSHEIRTPLNGIMGMSDYLLTEPHLEDQIQPLNIIKDSSDTLLTTINDILDFSKIESGRLSLEITDLSLEAIVASVVDLLGPKAKGRGVDLFYRVYGNVRRILYGDPHRIKQILLNLVGNAVKFTRTGEINVSVRELSSTAMESVVEIAVQDTGIGIPDTSLPSLFDPFTQADTSTTRQFGGTGLGLSITKKLVTAMGGTIQVTSTVGVGSTFTLKIILAAEAPYGKAEHLSHTVGRATTEGIQTAPVHGRILVAEDNPVNQQVILAALARFGLSVDVVNNGLEAVEAYQRTEYNLILMDCQMPVMDGYEASRQIRSRETGERTKIIALTANVLEGVEEACVEAGMDGYISKPFRMKEFRETVLHHLSEPETPA